MSYSVSSFNPFDKCFYEGYPVFDYFACGFCGCVPDDWVWVGVVVGAVAVSVVVGSVVVVVAVVRLFVDGVDVSWLSIPQDVCLD